MVLPVRAGCFQALLHSEICIETKILDRALIGKIQSIYDIDSEC